MSIRLSARIAAALVTAPLAVSFLAGPAAAQGGKPTKAPKPAKTVTVETDGASTDGFSLNGTDGFSLNGASTDDAGTDGFSLNGATTYGFSLN